MVPLAGFEPARPQGTTDFESAASTVPPQRQRLITYNNNFRCWIA